MGEVPETLYNGENRECNICGHCNDRRYWTRLGVNANFVICDSCLKNALRGDGYGTTKAIKNMQAFGGRKKIISLVEKCRKELEDTPDIIEHKKLMATMDKPISNNDIEASCKIDGNVMIIEIFINQLAIKEPHITVTKYCERRFSIARRRAEEERDRVLEGKKIGYRIIQNIPYEEAISEQVRPGNFRDYSFEDRRKMWGKMKYKYTYLYLVAKKGNGE